MQQQLWSQWESADTKSIGQCTRRDLLEWIVEWCFTESICWSVKFPENQCRNKFRIEW